MWEPWGWLLLFTLEKDLKSMAFFPKVDVVTIENEFIAGFTTGDTHAETSKFIRFQHIHPTQVKDDIWPYRGQ